jgi:copper resistance protein B
MRPATFHVIPLAMTLACWSGAVAAGDAHAAHRPPPTGSPQSAEPQPQPDHGSMDHGSPSPELPPVTEQALAEAFPDLGDMHMSEHMDDDPFNQSWIFDRIERKGSGVTAEVTAWFGGDANRLWARGEFERHDGETESAALELLWGRPLGPWWDGVVGLRQDFAPGPDQTALAVGVIGLAPYKFEVEATAYVAGDGYTALRLEAEYELLLSNRLILQPGAEAELHGRSDPERGLGSGLSRVELGLRLRYEISREFAPYVGWSWERAFGQTAEWSRAEGEPVSDGRWVLGVRMVF